MKVTPPVKCKQEAGHLTITRRIFGGVCSGNNGINQAINIHLFGLSPSQFLAVTILGFGCCRHGFLAGAILGFSHRHVDFDRHHLVFQLLPYWVLVVTILGFDCHRLGFRQLLSQVLVIVLLDSGHHHLVFWKSIKSSILTV